MVMMDDHVCGRGYLSQHGTLQYEQTEQAALAGERTNAVATDKIEMLVKQISEGGKRIYARDT